MILDYDPYDKFGQKDDIDSDPSFPLDLVYGTEDDIARALKKEKNPCNEEQYHENTGRDKSWDDSLSYNGHASDKTDKDGSWIPDLGPGRFDPEGPIGYVV